MLADLLSQSGQLGTNLPFSAPPAVPDSARLMRGAAGGLGADTPTGVPPTESPGLVLLTTQEDLPPPNVNVCVADGIASLGVSLVPGLGQVNRCHDVTDQLRVSDVAHSANDVVTSALSPRSLLFPFSDSSFTSLSSSLSSSLPTSTPSVSLASSSSSSSFLPSSFDVSQPVSSFLSPSPLPPPPFPSSVPPRSAPLPPPPGFPPLVPSWEKKQTWKFLLLLLCLFLLLLLLPSLCRPWLLLLRLRCLLPSLLSLLLSLLLPPLPLFWILLHIRLRF